MFSTISAGPFGRFDSGRKASVRSAPLISSEVVVVAIAFIILFVPLVVTGIHLDCVLFSCLFLCSAGGSSPLMSLLLTKLLVSWEDIGADHSDVPAWLWRLQAFTPLFQ